MEYLKVVKVNDEILKFSNGSVLFSDHERDCCESHYLGLGDLSLDDFDGLEFDLTNDDFFERIEGYGILLKPVNGLPVRIPGYGYNNGYYSSQLDMVIVKSDGSRLQFDISQCQNIQD